MSKIDKLIEELKQKGKATYEISRKLANQTYKNQKEREKIEKEIAYLEKIKKLKNIPQWEEERTENKWAKEKGHKETWSERISYRLNTPKHYISISLEDRLKYTRDRYIVEISAFDNESRYYFIGNRAERIEKVFKTREEAILFAKKQQKEINNLLASHMLEIKELLEIK